MLFFTYCKEEPVQPKEVKSTAEITAAKVADNSQIALQLDNDKIVDKEKFEKLKSELEKPHAGLKKPIEVLKEYLRERKTGKTSSVSSAGKSINQKQTMQAICNPIYVEYWMIDKYTPKTGSLGIHPADNFQEDLNYQSEMKNKYGFSSAILHEMGARKNIDYNGPFSSTEIYLGFDFQDPSSVVNCINLWDKGEVAGCYIDEPTEEWPLSSSTTLLAPVKQVWDSKFSSPIVVGDRTHYLMDLNDHLADYVTYTHWTNYVATAACCYTYTSSDQRPAWDAFGNSFGGKRNFLWVYDDDYGEFYNLFGYAKNNGNDIWLYRPSSMTLYEFCYQGWLQDYLNRVERKYILEYTYIGTGDPCTDEDESHWWLTNMVQTQFTRTL